MFSETGSHSVQILNKLNQHTTYKNASAYLKFCYQQNGHALLLVTKFQLYRGKIPALWRIELFPILS